LGIQIQIGGRKCKKRIRALEKRNELNAHTNYKTRSDDYHSGGVGCDFGVVCGVIRGWSAAYLFAIHLDVGHIILEHGGHIDLGELIFAEDNQKASFTAGTVADNYQFLANRRHWKFCKRQSRNCTRMQSDAGEFDSDSNSPVRRSVLFNLFAKTERTVQKLSK